VENPLLAFVPRKPSALVVNVPLNNVTVLEHLLKMPPSLALLAHVECEKLILVPALALKRRTLVFWKERLISPTCDDRIRRPERSEPEPGGLLGVSPGKEGSYEVTSLRKHVAEQFGSLECYLFILYTTTSS
jgi:hypothetical protein